MLNITPIENEIIIRFLEGESLDKIWEKYNLDTHQEVEVRPERIIRNYLKKLLGK